MLLDEITNAGSDAKVVWTAEEDEDMQIAVEEHGVGNWAAGLWLFLRSRRM